MPPTRLSQCRTQPERLAWCTTMLNAGRTLSYTSLYLSGADPGKLIRALLKQGLDIECVKTTLVDCSDESIEDDAWRLRKSA